MSFDVAQFSNDGLTLLAQLSSSKSLRIKNIYVDEISHTSIDLEENQAWWATQTQATMAKLDAVLDAAGIVGNQARLVVKMNLKQEQTQTVKARTIVLTACATENDVEGPEIVFCGVSDENGVEVLYNASGIKLSSSVAISFKFNTASSISFEEAINPDYVVHSELDRLMSCHKIGDTTSGDDQDVYGNKFFKDSPYINIKNSNSLIFTYDGKESNHWQGSIGDTGTTGIAFTSLNVLEGDKCFSFIDDSFNVPHTIMTMNCLDQDSFIINVASNIVPDNTTIASGVSSVVLGTSSAQFGNVYTAQITMKGSSISAGPYIYTLETNADLLPDVGNTRILGTVDKYWKNIYSAGFNVKRNGGIELESTRATNNMLTIYEEDGDLVFDNFVSGRGLSVSGIVSATDMYTRDLTVRRNLVAKDITADTINAALPTPSSTTDIPVGCICVLWSSTFTARGTVFGKNSTGTSWRNLNENQDITLAFGDLEPSINQDLVDYTAYDQSTRFVALSRASAEKSFLAIRTA